MLLPVLSFNGYDFFTTRSGEDLRLVSMDDDDQIPSCLEHLVAARPDLVVAVSYGTGPLTTLYGGLIDAAMALAVDESSRALGSTALYPLVLEDLREELIATTITELSGRPFEIEGFERLWLEPEPFTVSYTERDEIEDHVVTFRQRFEFYGAEDSIVLGDGLVLELHDYRSGPREQIFTANPWRGAPRVVRA